MITLGADGRMTALRQVLTPENFARVQPGQRMDEVRRLLGKPAKVTPYTLKNETHVDWRYLEGSNQAKVFTVVHGPDHVVLRTQTGPDLDSPSSRAASEQHVCHGEAAAGMDDAGSVLVQSPGCCGHRPPP